jgi:hypothetical protein
MHVGIRSGFFLAVALAYPKYNPDMDNESNHLHHTP